MTIFLVAKLPRSLWTAYEALTGVVEVRVARALLEVASRRLEVYVSMEAADTLSVEKC